jgi:hypothetical protein
VWGSIEPAKIHEATHHEGVDIVLVEGVAVVSPRHGLLVLHLLFQRLGRRRRRLRWCCGRDVLSGKGKGENSNAADERPGCRREVAMLSDWRLSGRRRTRCWGGAKREAEAATATRPYARVRWEEVGAVSSFSWCL